MHMDWLSLLEWVGIVGGAAVGLRVLWGLLKKLYERMRTMFGITALRDDITELGCQLDFLVAELRPNGGTSIKDQLNRVEASVALTNERQRARMLDARDMVFETDPQGHCIWVNRTYARTVQRLPAELLGNGWVNAIAKDDRDRVSAEWHQSVTDSREFDMGFNFATPDGTLIPAWVRSYKMSDANKKVVGYLGSVTLL